MNKNQALTTQLKRLTGYPACSGNEANLISHIKQELTPFADKIFIDKVGNLVALKGNSNTAIFAHADKIGYMVSAVDKSISAVPLAKGKALPVAESWPVTIHGKKPIAGALVEKPAGKLIIQSKASQHSAVGNFICLTPNFSTKGNHISSQGLDNCLGLLAAIEVFKNAQNIAFIATVQEETSKLGAKTAVFNHKPKSVIVLDVTYDESAHNKQSVKVGSGPAVGLKDDLLSDQHLTNRLISAAKMSSLPYQLEVLEAGSSDANAVYDQQGGTPCSFLGIPLKNMHTPHESAGLSDLVNTIHLLTNFFNQS